jgi:hypothetical protein
MAGAVTLTVAPETPAAVNVYVDDDVTVVAEDDGVDEGESNGVEDDDNDEGEDAPAQLGEPSNSSEMLNMPVGWKSGALGIMDMLIVGVNWS